LTPARPAPDTGDHNASRPDEQTSRLDELVRAISEGVRT
jgi:hypothetical protein